MFDFNGFLMLVFRGSMMPWMAALVFSLKTPHSQKSQGYMFEEQEGQMFFSANIGIFSCKKSCTVLDP